MHDHISWMHQNIYKNSNCENTFQFIHSQMYKTGDGISSIIIIDGAIHT